jgi:hypothetical protein
VHATEPEEWRLVKLNTWRDQKRTALDDSGKSMRLNMERFVLRLRSRESNAPGFKTVRDALLVNGR